MAHVILLLLGGVAVYAVAGAALSLELARCGRDRGRCNPRRLLAPAAGGPLGLALAAVAAAALYRRMGLPEHPPSPAAGLGAAGLALAGLVAGGALLLGAVPRRRGGSGPDDLPPPPDPDGPDGWDAFERAFRAYAGRPRAGVG